MRGEEFYTEFAGKPPLSKAHPVIGAFFKEYLANEKVVGFGGRYVINTHLPPYPGRAFEGLVERFSGANAGGHRLYSVTLAVTNRCPYDCWHCYNAGRNQTDVGLAALKGLAGELQGLGATVVTLTGGEPLLRKDLEEVAAAFDDRTNLVLNTTGAGLTAARACSLKESGVFAAGMSLDSTDEAEHDRMRGRKGAFRTALAALGRARENGLYPYVISLATREFLEPERFRSFMDFARDAGALEVHLLEPSATGRLAHRTDVLLGDADRKRILEYQAEFARREDMPVVSSFAYIESDEAFGCGAGLTHLYIDGSGEVCPCNLVPVSFGNVLREPLAGILDRMGEHFCRPRTGCVGRILGRHIPEGPLPTPPEVSQRICQAHLPKEHETPRFFRVAQGGLESVGQDELRTAYDSVHGDYDEFWLKEASQPIEELIERLHVEGTERVFEAGCGTGYATAALAGRLTKGGQIVAADLSGGMLAQAARRASAGGLRNITFEEGDALEVLSRGGGYDLIFSSWVLGYIPLGAFFEAAARALRPGGRLAFVVHKENSPREPLEIFGRLVAEDPAALEKRVAFDFPRDKAHVEGQLRGCGLRADDLWDGAITFTYGSAEQVLEHLLKSGAGTAFHDAIDPKKRTALERRFLEILSQRHGNRPPYEVVHDYVACIAGRA